TLALQHFSHFGGPALGGLRIEVRFHHVVVMALNAVEAELLVFPNLGGKGHLFPHRRTKRIRADADVPRAERKPIRSLSGIGGHGSALPKMLTTSWRRPAEVRFIDKILELRIDYEPGRRIPRDWEASCQGN